MTLVRLALLAAAVGWLGCDASDPGVGPADGSAPRPDAASGRDASAPMCDPPKTYGSPACRVVAGVPTLNKPACYTPCDPASPACPDGFVCEARAVDPCASCAGGTKSCCDDCAAAQFLCVRGTSTATP
jgi:hypothetical protein